jgi:hypothetical protein
MTARQDYIDALNRHTELAAAYSAALERQRAGGVAHFEVADFERIEKVRAEAEAAYRDYIEKLVRWLQSGEG